MNGIDDSRAILVAKLAAAVMTGPRDSYAFDAMDSESGGVIESSVAVARKLLDEAYRQCPVMAESIKPVDP